MPQIQYAGYSPEMHRAAMMNTVNQSAQQNVARINANAAVDVARENAGAQLGSTQMRTAMTRDIELERLRDNDKARDYDKWRFERDMEHQNQMFELRKQYNNALNTQNWEQRDKTIDKQINFETVKEARQRLAEARSLTMMLNVLEQKGADKTKRYQAHRTLQKAAQQSRKQKDALRGTQEAMRRSVGTEIRNVLDTVTRGSVMGPGPAEPQFSSAKENLYGAMGTQLGKITEGRIDAEKYEMICNNPQALAGMLKAGEIRDTDITALHMLNEVVANELDSYMHTNKDKLPEHMRDKIGTEYYNDSLTDKKRPWYHYPVSRWITNENRFYHKSQVTGSSPYDNPITKASVRISAAEELAGMIGDLNTQLAGVYDGFAESKDPALMRAYEHGLRLSDTSSNNPMYMYGDMIDKATEGDETDYNMMRDFIRGSVADNVRILKERDDSEYADRFVESMGDGLGDIEMANIIE